MLLVLYDLLGMCLFQKGWHVCMAKHGHALIFGAPNLVTLAPNHRDSDGEIAVPQRKLKVLPTLGRAKPHRQTNKPNQVSTTPFRLASQPCALRMSIDWKFPFHLRLLLPFLLTVSLSFLLLIFSAPLLLCSFHLHLENA